MACLLFPRENGGRIGSWHIGKPSCLVIYPILCAYVLTLSFSFLFSSFFHFFFLNLLAMFRPLFELLYKNRSLLVANVGDCRAVLSRLGVAIEMSKDHRPCCKKERSRIESLGGFIDDGYLNGQLGVTRALGDWHLEGMKSDGECVGPLSAEPELKLITLTKEDEFLIICSDGIWDVFTSQNAVDFVRRQLQEHNDVKMCCKELVDEALKRGAIDNLTIVMICFHSEPPPHVVVNRSRVRRSISAEGLHNLRCLLEGP